MAKKLPKPSRSLETNPREYSKRRFRKSTLFRYDPKLDMTVWELARFVGLLMEGKLMHFERFFTIIPPKLRRHFRQVKNG